ncbi:MAG: anthranilate/aminodeoxychorismate synthase component II [Gammaproteobacteria bacterium]|nr:anthranilate/aminodeoxychorismate synthase component II [Gammaproteobacteria bacterium]|tara:strand:+ start:179 stop:751 length:573 start_codon:yes stop_codon:yes gene_type:complete
MILMIDNYDSFTYNIVQYIGELGANVKIFRNDEITLDEIKKLKPKKIIISPGPCTPNEAGISIEAIKQFGDSIPILGICLGHQSIGQAFGGKIISAKKIMHGKTSKIIHNNDKIFKGITNPFEATRYHSLVIEKETIPKCFEIIAWTNNSEDDEIMGVKHNKFPIYGLQFHPESILTKSGKNILKNFLDL